MDLARLVAPAIQDSMPTRNALKGVLAGFLGTYTSRNSDYRGYWLLGFLVAGGGH